MKRLLNSLPIGTMGRQLVQGGLLGLIVRVLAILAGFTSSIVLARVMGPAEYGVYAFVFAIIAILALPVQMGLPTLIIRETARACANQDWPLLRGMWSWSGRVIIASSLLMLGAVLAWLSIHGDSVNSHRVSAFLWGLPLLPLLAFAEARGAALLGLGRIFQGQFPDQVLHPMLLALFAGSAAWLFSIQITAKTALSLSVLAAFSAFVLGAAFLVRARPKELRETKHGRMEHRQWMKAIVPLSIIVGLQVITGNTSLVVLGFFRADSEVAIYRVALSISSIATFGLITSYTVIQPYIVRLNAANNQRSLQFIASAGALAALAVTVPVLGIYIFSGKYLLDFLYGSGFVAAYSPLIVLTFGAALHAIFGMGGGLLTMTGNERYVLRASVLTAGLNVLLNLFLTPTYGAMGAATATAIALVAGQMLAYYMAKGLLGIDGSPLYIISAALTRRAEKNSTGNTFD